MVAIFVWYNFSTKTITLEKITNHTKYKQANIPIFWLNSDKAKYSSAVGGNRFSKQMLSGGVSNACSGMDSMHVQECEHHDFENYSHTGYNIPVWEKIQQTF